ncbi:CDGSH iron-sulfur domain-containing protein [Pasteuria penetrans]|uniref:CDGSH iron-sulfur domain-containing protein n=1 Tax=Pasteuria penetrans TaxID=86005 RepID=UPI000FAC6897|nr:CDGSH iron-sulfur domain-containing protein [Pasteuria penetrans]
MEKVRIEIRDHGPLIVRNGDNVQLVDSQNNEIPHKSLFSLCRCGLSDKKPFCDGQHRAKGFESCVRADNL